MRKKRGVKMGKKKKIVNDIGKKEFFDNIDPGRFFTDIMAM